ncbi:MAG: hypothetical protein Q9216_004732 [Gyalolechia sp. 2 TL-2023]
MLFYIQPNKKTLSCQNNLSCMIEYRSRLWNSTRQLYLHKPVRRCSKSYELEPTYHYLRNFSSCIQRFTSSAQKDAGETPGSGDQFVLPAVLPLHDTQDIHVNDLGATLEAHRATNRAKIIRRVQAPSNPTIKPLFKRESNDANNSGGTCPTENTQQAVKERKQEEPIAEKVVDDIENNKRKPWEFWPAGSMQHQKLNGSKQHAPPRSVSEYHARSVNPIGSWKLPSKNPSNTDLSRPWHRYLDEHGGDALQRLGNEIIAFERYITPSSAGLNAMRKVVSQVNHVVNSTIDKCSCDVIGSYSTGLALAYSDIDFAISLPDVEEEAAVHRKSLNGLDFRKQYRRILFKLQKAFAKDINFAESSSVVVYARTPIVRVTHRITGQEIQVQLWTGARQQQQHTLAYLAEYPALRPLYFVIRSCLEMRRLNITFEGGLGSYPLLMSIVNALKHASGRYDPHDVGSQLLHVLDFYTSSDLYHTGFSIEPPRTFRKGEIRKAVKERLSRASDPVLCGIDLIGRTNPRHPYLLCLQDPADPTNDLGRKAYAIKHIQQTFATARKIMVSGMEAWDQRPNGTTANDDNISLLDALVHGNYGRFEHDRRGIESYGSPAWRHFRSRIVAEGSHNGGKISAREMLEKIDEVDKRKAATSSRDRARAAEGESSQPSARDIDEASR